MIRATDAGLRSMWHQFEIERGIETETLPVCDNLRQ